MILKCDCGSRDFVRKSVSNMSLTTDKEGVATLMDYTPTEITYVCAECGKEVIPE